MNNFAQIGAEVVVKQMYKACTTLWVSLDLYTQNFLYRFFRVFITTTNRGLGNLFTNLLHSQCLQNNRLCTWVLHTLHRLYCYYELNKLNTNKGID